MKAFAFLECSVSAKAVRTLSFTMADSLAGEQGSTEIA
jgi:hypothetical protein